MSEDVQGPAGTIQAIDKGSVHRICSGQVVLTLATAIKELVENSIDAGATTIEVKLREYGSEVIEVNDNGFGVEEKNFEGLTLKHHTSKLQDFSDLVGVNTFGFRGEALSSLCALSDLSITTRHTSADVGTKLEYDHNGRIENRCPQARQRGTTVVLQNLFSTLPVRYKEFQRNLKKEFAKMVQVLNSYCIISTGVRISCTNQLGKGNRSVVVSSSGNTNMRDNIANVFGSKQIQSLLEFKKKQPSEDITSEYGLTSNEGSLDLFNIEGYVSKCVHGQGRSSTDRQFYFINKRPCDYAKISKVVNEVYHQYNRHQYPFVALSINMAKESVDVNVTPDKRQIFLQHEKLLLAVIKASLIDMYEPTTSILQFNNTLQKSHSVQTLGSEKDEENSSTAKQITSVTKDGYEKVSLSSSLNKLKRSFTSAFAKEENTSPSKKETTTKQISKQRKLDTFVSKSSTLTTLSSSKFKFNDETSEADFESTPNSFKKELVISESASNSDCMVIFPETLHISEQTDTESGISSSQETLTSQYSLESNSSERTFCSSSSAGNYVYIECSSNQSGSQNTQTFDSPMNELKITYDGSSGNESQKTQSFEYSSNSENTQTFDSLRNESYNAYDNSSGNESQKTQTFDSEITNDTVNTHSFDSSSVDESVNTQTFERSDTLTDDSCNTQIFDSPCISENIEHLSQSSVEECVKKLSVYRNKNCCNDTVSSEKTCFEDYNLSNSNPSESVCTSKSSCHDNSEATLKVTEYDERETVKKKEKIVQFSFSKLKEKCKLHSIKSDSLSEFCRNFRAKISPTDNQAAEAELQKEISKDMFDKMEILGQFNLGFIISKLGEDLFIVDQHATDEKYNFEMLQRHTVLQNQKLIQPQCLELTAGNETILMDNLEVFKKNGFDFIIDEEGPPTRRVKLVSAPVSKNWNFGKDDIEELIFMLTDCPGVMCRPTRVRQMFASRACRKSIMVGTALKKSEMKRLLSHMGEIEQPWNCPHGRPTMRHLINLQMIPK